MSPPNGATADREFLKVRQEKAPLEEEQALDEETQVVVPPDGGWGWVVVFASFMCNMIVDGIIFSFGSFLQPIAADFRVSQAHVALVGSLMSGFYLIAGPFASAVANRYGFRLVAIGGSILAAISFALSYFAPNVEYLCVIFGVLGGIGFGFIYVPSVITVGFYFEKWRALATGIGVCGSGIGTFVFAPMTTALIDNLGWRTALLVQGGIVVACAAFGALYRPLKPKKVREIKLEAEAAELKMDPAKLPPLTKLKMEEALKKINMDQVYHTISIPQQRVLDIYCYEKRLSVPFFANDDKLMDAAANDYLLAQKPATADVAPQADVARPMYRDDIFFSASLTRLPQYTSRTSLAYNVAVTKPPTKTDVEEEKKKECLLCPEAVKRALSTMLDVSLLRSPTFLILAFGGFFTMMGFYVPFMYLADRASMEGMPRHLTLFLISAIGISNTIGRVLCGVLSSFPGVNALFVTNAALTIGGIATMLSGVSISPEYQFTYTTVFGLAISCFASLRSIIVVDLLGLEKLTNAFGLLLLFQGVAAVIGAPLAGAFKEYTGSYDASFYLSGGMLLFSAVVCYPLNYINKREMEKKRRTENV